MKNTFSLTARSALVLGAALLLCAAPRPSAAAEESTADGFKPIFNGKDLTGWGGLPQFWSVRDGAITGQTTKEHPAKSNTFLIWRGGDVGDFELRLTYKITPNNPVGFANSGIQYRSKIYDRTYFVVGGYQADMEAGKTYSGILYEERERGILAERGQKVVIHADPSDPNKPKIEVVGSLGSSAEIQANIKPDDWNEYVIIARGNHLQHFINGMQTVDVVDEQTNKAAKSGILALQLHAGQPMTVQFKNIRLKTLAPESNALDQIQGEWRVTQFVSNGEQAAPDRLASVKLHIKGSEFTLEDTDATHRGKLALNDQTHPGQMDATMDDGTEIPGIYEVSGDTFKVCYALNGASRPTKFEAADGSDHVLTVYKRAP